MSKWLPLSKFIIDSFKGPTPKYVPSSSTIVLNQKCIRNNEVDFSLAQYIDENQNINPDRYLKPGDILVNSTGTGTAGRAAFLSKIPEGVRLVVDSHILVLRCDDYHLARCIAYLLYSFEDTLMSFVTGSSGQSELDKVVLLDLKIDISSSQERIKNTSQLLEIIEDKIQNNRNLIQEIEKLIEELFNYWFLQFEFPNSDGKPYLSSGGKLKYCKRLKMEIPDEWISGVAEDLFIFNPNLSLKKGVEAPFIDMNALPLKGFNTKKPIQKNYNGGVKFQNGDVLIARITPSLENGKTALVSQVEEGVTAFGSTEFIVMRGRSIPLSHFASCLARSNHFRKFAIANMLGTSGRKRVDSDVLETFSLAIPPRSTLHLFETTVSPMFEEMANKHQENDELIKIREWLIPQLIKGDTKV